MDPRSSVVISPEPGSRYLVSSETLAGVDCKNIDGEETNMLKIGLEVQEGTPKARLRISIVEVS